LGMCSNFALLWPGPRFIGGLSPPMLQGPGRKPISHPRKTMNRAATVFHPQYTVHL
jgi:hypothetical protein